MKKLFYSLFLAVLLSPAYLMAQDTFYVKSNGKNSNAGTEQEPWGTLNHEKWTDGCTIIIVDEIYLDPAIEVSQEGTLTNITIQGGAPEAALMGLNDDEFADGELNTSYFFDLKDVKLTLKDITLKNLNREEGNGAGGMIYGNPYSELILDNVVMKNSVVDVGVNCRGGAIWTEGKLTVSNSVFENCKAFQGGAVYLKETEEPIVARFENTIFRNNQTVNGSAENGSGAAGGALYIEGKELDIVFDKCYFDSNYAWNGAKNANGGVLRLQTPVQPNANVTFSNCTMANNKSEGASAFMMWSRPDEGVVNLKFTNNVFYKNRTAGLQSNILTAQKGSGDANVGLSGSLVFVNNTSIMNNTGADGLLLMDQTAMNVTDFGGDFDLIFVNNIMLDCMIEPITTPEKVIDQQGWGWSIRETYGRSQGTYIIKNNIHDGVGGAYQESWGEGFLYHFLNEDAATANNNKSIRGKTTDQKLEQVGIARVLSGEGTVPYIAINIEDAYAIDRGISSLIHKGVELIPQTDIVGTAIIGEFRDLGAFEFNKGGSSLPGIENDPDEISAYINPKTNILHISEEIVSAKIYSISGLCVLTESNTESMSVDSLVKGVYVIQVVDKQGNVHSFKIMK